MFENDDTYPYMHPTVTNNTITLEPPAGPNPPFVAWPVAMVLGNVSPQEVKSNQGYSYYGIWGFRGIVIGGTYYEDIVLNATNYNPLVPNEGLPYLVFNGRTPDDDVYGGVSTLIGGGSNPLVIPMNRILTIDPNTCIYVDGDREPSSNYNIYISGALVTNGTAESPVFIQNNNSYGLGWFHGLWAADQTSTTDLNNTRFRSNQYFDARSTLELGGGQHEITDSSFEWMSVLGASGTSVIDRCTFSGSDRGFYPVPDSQEATVALSEGNHTVSNCQFDSLGGASVIAYAGSPTIVNNTSQRVWGLEFFNISSATVQNNHLYSNIDDGGVGIWFHGCSGGTYSNNTISNRFYGIYAESPAGPIGIVGNSIENNLYGAYCTGTGTLTVENNWWGHISGPNLSNYWGKNKIYGNVSFMPWNGMEEWFARVYGPNWRTVIRGEPVNVHTGNFYQTHADLNFEGTGPRISVTRTYNSLDCETSGAFGYGWSWTYSAHITEDPYDTDYRNLVGPYGDLHRYIPSGDGIYAPEDQDYSALTHNQDGTWTISRKDGSWEKYDTSGLISQIADSSQNVVIVTRDLYGKVTSVTDASGQTVQFTSIGQNPDFTPPN